MGKLFKKAAPVPSKPKAKAKGKRALDQSTSEGDSSGDKADEEKPESNELLNFKKRLEVIQAAAGSSDQ